MYLFLTIALLIGLVIVVRSIRKNYHESLYTEMVFALDDLILEKKIDDVCRSDDSDTEESLEEHKKLIFEKLEEKNRGSIFPLRISLWYEFICRVKIDFKVLLYVIRTEMANILAVVGLILLFTQFLIPSAKVEVTVTKSNPVNNQTLLVWKGDIEEQEKEDAKKWLLKVALNGTLVLMYIYFVVFLCTSKQERAIYAEILSEDKSLDPITRKNISNFDGSAPIIFVGKMLLILAPTLAVSIVQLLSISK